LSTTSDLTHGVVEVPGGRIHLAAQGSGPLVLLVHGFPESWYSWRHQLPAIAAADFRAVAIDVRGYGRSSSPPDVEAYRMLAHVADNVGVVRALGEETATIVGHDWGAAIAADTALLRPDIFTAVALMGVPYAPRGGPRPTDAFAMIGGAEEFYVSYFQEPGRAEAEMAPDVRSWQAGFYAALSGDATPPADGGSVFFVPAGGRLSDRFADRGSPPPWLTESRPRRLRGRVRTGRGDRGAQPLPQRRSGLGGPRRVGRGAALPARAVHRRGARRLDRVDGRRHRRLSDDPPRAGLLAHPRGLWALGAAGARRRGQPPAGRLAQLPPS